MTPVPWTVDADLSIQDAARLMRAWDVREVLVTDDGALCGILTDHDIIVLAIASGRRPSTIRAGECARPDLHSVAAGDTCDQAIDYMVRHDERLLPVTDGQQLVGSVSIVDLTVACPRPSPRLSRA